VFFIQDAIKFPDLIHSVKMEPDRGFPQAASAHDTFWDFASLRGSTYRHWDSIIRGDSEPGKYLRYMSRHVSYCCDLVFRWSIAK
jgi:catalase